MLDLTQQLRSNTAQTHVQANQDAALDAAGERNLIVVIDDELSVRTIAQRMLQHFGYRVLAAEDGRTGLELVQNAQADLCLVLVDLTMPAMSGEMVAQAIKAQWERLPVMLMSGYCTADLTARAPDLGIDGVLQKPFTLASLRAALDQVLL